MNVILVGFRCSGKSCVGRALAGRLGREFIDCEEYIERRTGLPIREIFERHGESHFRLLESQAIAELAKLDGKVLAMGGGAVLKHKNIQALKRHGLVVYLRVSVETVLERMTGSRGQGDPGPEIRAQMEVREPYYRECADVEVGTDGRGVEEVVEEILAHLRGKGFVERADLDASPD